MPPRQPVGVGSGEEGRVGEIEVEGVVEGVVVLLVKGVREDGELGKVDESRVLSEVMDGLVVVMSVEEMLLSDVGEVKAASVEDVVDLPLLVCVETASAVSMDDTDLVVLLGNEVGNPEMMPDVERKGDTEERDVSVVLLIPVPFVVILGVGPRTNDEVGPKLVPDEEIKLLLEALVGSSVGRLLVVDIVLVAATRAVTPQHAQADE